MFCHRIGGECPHKIYRDPNYIFVLMPFENSRSIYATIKRAVEGIPDHNFSCERADMRYTSFQIWCEKICQPVRRAKYVIVDVTGRNANVFYEMGFTHALGLTQTIIISQKIEDAPFDVRDLQVIEYTEKDFPKLEEDLQRAILDLEEKGKDPLQAAQTVDEMISELKKQLREEEKRSTEFKRELLATEARERELKKRLSELEEIKQDPEREATEILEEKEKEIKRLKEKLSRIDSRQQEQIRALEIQIQDEQEKRKVLEKELSKYKETKNGERLVKSTAKTKQKDWLSQLFELGQKQISEGKFEEAVQTFTKLIEADNKHQSGYFYRAFCFYELKKYDETIADYTKAIELDPSYLAAKLNLTELLIITGAYEEAEKLAGQILTAAEQIKDKAVAHFLMAISLRLMNKNTKQVDTAYNKLCQKDFVSTFSVNEIEDWLKGSDFSNEIKKYIREKIEMLKKHCQ